MIGMKPATLVVAALAFPALVWLHAEDRMRAGLWQVSRTVDGKPAGKSSTTCYTPEMVQIGNGPASTSASTLTITICFPALIAARA